MKKVHGLVASLLAVVFVMGCDRSGTVAGDEMLVSGVSTRLGVGQDSLSAANDTGASARDTVDPYRVWTVGLKVLGSDSAKIDSVTVRWGDGSEMEGFNRHSRFLRHQWAIKDTGRHKLELFAWSSGSLVRQDSQFIHVTTHAMALQLCEALFTTAWNIDSVLELPVTTMDERPLQQVRLHASAVGSDSSFDTIVPALGQSWLSIGLKFPPSGTSDSLVKWSIRLDLLASSGDSTTDKFVLEVKQHPPVLDSVVGMPESALRGDTLRVQAFASASKGIARYEWTINSQVIFLSGDRLVLPMNDTGWICASVKVYDSVGNPSTSRDFSQFVRTGTAPVPVSVPSVAAVSGQSIVVPMETVVDSGHAVSWVWNVADRIYRNGALETVVLSGATQSASLSLSLQAPGPHRLARKATNSRGDTTWDTVEINVAKRAPGLSELKVQGAETSGSWVNQYLWMGAYSVLPAALDSQDATLPVTIWADTGAGKYDFKVSGTAPLRTSKLGIDTLRLKLVGIYGDSSLVQRGYRVTGLDLRDTLVHAGDTVGYVLESNPWDGAPREWSVTAPDRKLSMDAKGSTSLVTDTFKASGKGLVAFRMALKDTGAHPMTVVLKDAFGATLQESMSVNVWRRGLRIDSVLASGGKGRMIDGAHYKIGTMLPVILAVTDSESVVANANVDSVCWTEDGLNRLCGNPVALPSSSTGRHLLTLTAYGKPWGGSASSFYDYTIDSAPVAKAVSHVCAKSDSACDIPAAELRVSDPQNYLLLVSAVSSAVTSTDATGNAVGTVTYVTDAKGNGKFHISWNGFAWNATWNGSYWTNFTWKLNNASFQYKATSPFGIASSPAAVSITFK